MRIVMEVTSQSRRAAQRLLARAEGKVKVAIVMHYRKVDLSEALNILEECDQSLRKAIQRNIDH